MAASNFSDNRAALEALLATRDRANCTRVVNNVLSRTAEFLTNSNAIAGNPSIASLEALNGESVPVLNKSLSVLSDVGVGRVFEYVQSCGVPAVHQKTVALEVLRILNNGIDRTAILAPEPTSKEHMSVESFAGRGGAMMLAHDAKVSMEAFGADIDRLQIDNRLNIVMTVLRSFTSVADKLFPRVVEEGNVVTINIPSPQVYDLASSMNASAAVRYNPANLLPLVYAFRQPDPISTKLKPIVPLSANDTGTVKSLYGSTTSLATGVSSNLFDLAMNAGVYGYNAIDFTDLVAPGGRITNVYVQATHTASGVTTQELFKIPVKSYAQAQFVGNPNNMDSGDVIVSMSASTMVSPASTTAAGANTTMFASYATASVQLNLQFNSQLNLKTSQINGAGSVSAVLVPTVSTTPIAGATTTDFGLIAWSVVAYDPELYYDEENMRKTTLAVRLNTIQRQFVIPEGRNIVVDYSLNQSTSEEVASLATTVTALGNSARCLGIMSSVLTDMHDAIAFEQANPTMASLVNSRMNSIAGTLCIPYVTVNTLDFSDSTIAVLRESERLSELHGRLRQRLLTTLTTVCNQSLYLNNLEAGEKPVFKVLTAQVIADQLFGIIDYHNDLNDRVQAATGVDYSMELPNGYRLDIVKTNFVDYASSIVVVPVREAQPEHVTSFATIRDRGTYVAQYTPINNGAVARRVVNNSREILFVSLY